MSPWLLRVQGHQMNLRSGKTRITVEQTVSFCTCVEETDKNTNNPFVRDDIRNTSFKMAFDLIFDKREKKVKRININDR